MARTRRSDCNADGISRQRRGKGFSYRWPDGTAVKEKEVLDRIAALAIPPAWTDVWICTWPNGHIQATGTDKAGRRQYRYHDEWRKRRDAEKFERIREFGLALPRLREAVDADLRRRGLGFRRVTAAAVRMLDVGYFRIGNEEYADEHDTYGVSTLLKSHVRREGDKLVFDYEAKGSKRRVVAIEDPQLLPLIASLKRRRSGGDSLLAFKRKGGWVDLRSTDVNAYIKDHAGEQFSAKDFRTWSATVMAAVGLGLEEIGEARPGKATVNRVIRQVADAIGDTPAVCRSSYVDPVLVDRFNSGETVAATLRRTAGNVDGRDWPGELGDRARCSIEKAVIRLLNGH